MKWTKIAFEYSPGIHRFLNRLIGSVNANTNRAKFAAMWKICFLKIPWTYLTQLVWICSAPSNLATYIISWNVKYGKRRHKWQILLATCLSLYLDRHGLQQIVPNWFPESSPASSSFLLWLFVQRRSIKTGESPKRAILSYQLSLSCHYIRAALLSLLYFLLQRQQQINIYRVTYDHSSLVLQLSTVHANRMIRAVQPLPAQRDWIVLLLPRLSPKWSSTAAAGSIAQTKRESRPRRMHAWNAWKTGTCIT